MSKFLRITSIYFVLFTVLLLAIYINQTALAKVLGILLVMGFSIHLRYLLLKAADNRPPRKKKSDNSNN